MGGGNIACGWRACGKRQVSGLSYGGGYGEIRIPSRIVGGLGPRDRAPFEASEPIRPARGFIIACGLAAYGKRRSSDQTDRSDGLGIPGKPRGAIFGKSGKFGKPGGNLR